MHFTVFIQKNNRQFGRNGRHSERPSLMFKPKNKKLYRYTQLENVNKVRCDKASQLK